MASITPEKAYHMEKKRLHLTQHMIKEKKLAEHAAHQAKVHQHHAMGYAHASNRLGQKSIIGGIVVISFILFMLFLLARQYHLFGL